MEGKVAFIWGPLCARQCIFKKAALKVTGGHPWWLRGKESACQCGDMCSIPDLEISHMPRGN